MYPSQAPDVPIAWLCAERAAEDVVASSCGAVSLATFEFRATRDVLALTIFLVGLAAQSADPPTRRLALIRDRLCAPSEWLAWCRSALDEQGVAASAADLGLARNAWNWLGRCRMLAAGTLRGAVCDDAAASLQAGYRIGLAEARRIVGGVDTGSA